MWFYSEMWVSKVACALPDIIAVPLKVCKEVHEYFIEMERNNEYRDSIISLVTDLQTSIPNLQNIHEESEISEFYKTALMKFRNSLANASATCKSLKKQGSFQQLQSHHGNRIDLERIQSELQNAHKSLQFALQIANHEKSEEIKYAIKKESEHINTRIMNPDLGIYVNPSHHANVPECVERPSIALDRSKHLLNIKWVDTKNDMEEIDRYEICYDDENNHICCYKPKEIYFKSVSHGSEFVLKLGEPLVCPGRMYNMKVRGVNGAGPGDWSEAFLIRFLQGPPVRPQEPSLSAVSPTQIAVAVQMLSVKDECGSPVTSCRIEFTEVDDENATSWSSRTFFTEAQSDSLHVKKFILDGLKPCTLYGVRVVMINEIGESPCSFTKHIRTDCLVPGPPHNVRVSSKRKCKEIKVRWNEPNENAAGVNKYKVQFRRKKDNEWGAHATIGKEQLSHKVKNLKTDTKYYFRIQSLNRNNEGNYSEHVQGETRYGALGLMVSTTAAFFGGTVMGPILSPVAGVVSTGHVSAIAAREGPNSGTGKKAAAVAAGIAGGIGGFILGLIQIPIFGINTAITTNLTLRGVLDDVSPQSSDDEDAEPTVTGRVTREIRLKRNHLLKIKAN